MVNEEEEQQDQKKSGSKIQCHYEILCVERDADASTIKKAHRKQALKYHPDKNFGDEQASNTFLLVQQAYEVLSGKFFVLCVHERNLLLLRSVFTHMLVMILIESLFLPPSL